jgi:hypothetical protein
MKIFGCYLISLCLQIFKRLLQCFRCAMPNAWAICFLQCFHFPCILQHYTEFDTHTIIMLEMLLGAGSFGGSINHLTCRHATLLGSSSKLGLPFVVWTISPTFLGCWALIIFTLITMPHKFVCSHKSNKMLICAHHLDQNCASMDLSDYNTSGAKKCPLLL